MTVLSETEKLNGKRKELELVKIESSCKAVFKLPDTATFGLVYMEAIRKQDKSLSLCRVEEPVDECEYGYSNKRLSINGEFMFTLDRYDADAGDKVVVDTGDVSIFQNPLYSNLRIVYGKNNDNGSFSWVQPNISITDDSHAVITLPEKEDFPEWNTSLQLYIFFDKADGAVYRNGVCKELLSVTSY